MSSRVRETPPSAFLQIDRSRGWRLTFFFHANTGFRNLDELDVLSVLGKNKSFLCHFYFIFLG